MAELVINVQSSNQVLVGAYGITKPACATFQSGERRVSWGFHYQQGYAPQRNAQSEAGFATLHQVGMSRKQAL